MKQTLITSILCLLISSYSLACGDVESWQERYFNGQQLSALKFVHCPAIYEKYRNAKETDGMILKMISDAVSLYESIKTKNEVVANGYRDLALKNFIMFNQLKMVKDSAEYNEFLIKLAKSYAISLADLNAKLSSYSNKIPDFFKIENTFHDNTKYCEIVAKEVNTFLK